MSKRKHVRDRSARRRAVPMQEEPGGVSAVKMTAPVVGRLIGDIAEARSIVDRTATARGVPVEVARRLFVIRRMLDDVTAIVE